MTEKKSYEHGQFSWVDITTTDVPRSKEFYGSLFGWQAQDEKAPDGTWIYTTFLLRGLPVAGMGAMMEPMKAQGVPPFWMSYVTVEDCDATVARARAAGGKVLQDSMDVMDVGRMAVLEDPTGAAFSVWQKGTHIGAGLVNEKGTFCWNELMTRDAPRAMTFYREVFGWETEKSDFAGGSYWSIKNQGAPNGGCMPMEGERFESIPPNWLVYFTVEDADEAAKRVEQLGGKVLMPPTDIPGTGRFVSVADPVGAVFALIKLTM